MLERDLEIEYLTEGCLSWKKKVIVDVKDNVPIVGPPTRNC